jgi:O-antigen/teichoic acid export membrane protein
LALSFFGTLFLLKRLPSISDDNLAVPSVAQWFVVSAPLMVYALLFQFNAQAAVVVSGYLGHQAEAGLLGFASSYASFSTLGLLAVNVIVVPKIAALYRAGELASLQKMLSKANLFSILVFVLIAAVLWVIKPYYISASGFQHEQVSEAIDLIMLAQFVSVLCGTVGYVTIMTKRQREAIAVLLLSIIMQILIIMSPILLTGDRETFLMAYVASIVISNIGLLWVCIARVGVSPFFGLARLSSPKLPN